MSGSRSEKAKRAGFLLVLVVSLSLPTRALPATAAPSEGSDVGDFTYAPGDPVAFVKQTVEHIIRNEYAIVWRTLYPAHKRVAPLHEYVRCERLTPFSDTLDSIAVRRVSDRKIRIAGDARRTATKAITLRIRLLPASLGESIVVVHTVHAVAVGGCWTWILPGRRFELYRKNGCGFAPQPDPAAWHSAQMAPR